VSKIGVGGTSRQHGPGEAHRNQSTQVRCDAESGTDPHRTVVRQNGRINRELLDEGMRPTSQDLSHLPAHCNIPKIHIQKSLTLKIIFKCISKNYKSSELYILPNLVHLMSIPITYLQFLSCSVASASPAHPPPLSLLLRSPSPDSIRARRTRRPRHHAMWTLPPR
jgi:hypothetical protein